MGSVYEEITRLETAKTDIETAIEGCGVNVPDTKLISDYASYIRQIPSAVFSGLNVDPIGGNDTYIKIIEQTNGLISATTGGLVSSTSSGLVPKITVSTDLIKDQSKDWVLTSTDGAEPQWKKLPVSSFATSSGVVTALGTNGNYVTWTKNGTVNNLTVPYATTAGSANSVAWANVTGKPSTFTPSAHNHSQVLDIASSSATTFAYSKSGLNYGDYTWLAGWNGYELRAVNKAQFAQASHTHDDRYYTESEINTKLNSYLPLSGGQMNSDAYISWNNGDSGNDISDWKISGNGLRIISSITTTSKAPTQYSTALHVRGRYGFQLASQGGVGQNNFYIRNLTNDNWNTLIHSGNYTNYINTTNFPGLNKTGTVTSVTITQGTGITVSNSGTAITSSGTRTITLNSASSSAIGGVKLGYTESGANIPLKTSSDKGYVTLTKNAVVTALGYTPPTSDTNTNTTYSFTGGVDKFTVTPSSGSAVDVGVQTLLVNGTYTSNGGEQRPNYVGSGKVRWNMMRNTTTYYDVAAFSGYCDWMMMDTYTGSDVPYVTMIGVLKAATPHAYIASGAKGSSTGKWTIKTLLDSGNSSVSKSGQTLTVKINGVEQSLTNTTYSSLKNPNAIKFKNTSGTTITYDGSSAVDLTGGVNYANSARSIGGFTIANFMIFDGSSTSAYVGASFTDSTLSKVAAEKYIEFWDGAGGWFNSAWGKVTAHNGFVGNLTGTASYATSASLASKLTIHDVRDAVRNPNYFDDQRVTSWFNSTGTPTTAWHSGIHVKGWTNGYTSWELCSYASTGTANDYNLYFRSGNNTTWGNWKTIITSGNIGSIWTGTKAQYNSATKNNNTIYIIYS